MELMSSQQVSDLLGTPVETLHYWRWKGLGPISVKIFRAVRYGSWGPRFDMRVTTAALSPLTNRAQPRIFAGPVAL